MSSVESFMIVEKQKEDHELDTGAEKSSHLWCSGLGHINCKIYKYTSKSVKFGIVCKIHTVNIWIYNSVTG